MQFTIHTVAANRLIGSERVGFSYLTGRITTMQMSADAESSCIKVLEVR